LFLQILTFCWPCINC